MITAVDGTSIDSGDELASAIDAHKPGDTVTLQDAGRQELTVT